MKHTIYIILFLISFNGISQNFSPEEQHQIDSLNTIIANPNSHDTMIALTYLEVVNYYYLNTPDSAILYCEKVKVISEKLDYEYGKSESYGWLGSLYYNQGDIPKALEYYHKSLKIDEEIGNKEGIAVCLSNIGYVYDKQGNIPKALEYYHKSLKIDEEIGNKKGIATSLNNIGYVYNYQGDTPKALEYYHKSLKIDEEIGNKEGIAYSLNNIGFIYNTQGDLPKALEYFHKSLKIDEEVGNKEGIAYSLNNIGTIELEKDGNSGLAAAKQHLQKALNLAQEIGYPGLIADASGNLSKVYEKQGNGKEALVMYKLSITMRDSINNEATQKASAKQQAKYAYEKQKVLDDAEHDKLLAIEQEAKAKQKVITIAIGFGLGLVVVFLIFVFNRLQVTKKQKLVIEEQRDIVEEAHKEIRDSINYAERIQRSFLATDELLDANLSDYFVLFQPKDVVSGDFYWAGELSNGNFAIVNADSTGHGVPGAIMSILNISSIEKAIEKGLLATNEIFNDTRKTIIERLKKDGSIEGGKDGMDASIISFDFKNSSMSYCAAQNPIWIIRQGELIEIKGEKMPIGKHDHDYIPFKGGEFDLLKGDVVYTITDGFQDQFGGEKEKKFKVRPLKNHLISIAHLPMQEQKEKLTETFTNWQGELEQVDDVCVIGIKI